MISQNTNMQKTKKKNDERTIALLYVNIQLETIDTTMSLWKIDPNLHDGLLTTQRLLMRSGGGEHSL